MSTAGSSYVAGPAPRCNTEQGDPSQDLGSTSSLVLHAGLLDKQTPLPTPAPTRWGLRRGSSIIYSFSTSIHVQAVLQVRSHVHRHAWLQNFLLASFPTWEKKKKKAALNLSSPSTLKKIVHIVSLKYACSLLKFLQRIWGSIPWVSWLHHWLQNILT